MDAGGGRPRGFRYDLRPEPDDPRASERAFTHIEERGIRLAHHDYRVELPQDFGGFQGLHADLHAIAVWYGLEPFVGRALTQPFHVSAPFGYDPGESTARRFVIDATAWLALGDDEGESYWRVHVLSWDGAGFRDVTASHPELSLALVEQERAVIRDPAISDARYNVLALLANATLAGRADEERRWLQTHYATEPYTARWLERVDRALRRTSSPPP